MTVSRLDATGVGQRLNLRRVFTYVTNKNAALHFHLTISEGGESYADTEFIYQPLLDEQRDKDLLDLLPDYLTEEISFPRGHAAKFFSKVVDSMSKRIILEDGE